MSQPLTYSDLLHYFLYAIPIILPLGIAIFTSIYDKTFEEISEPTKQGRFAAKMCLSQISFDVWGITTLLSASNPLPYTKLTRGELGGGIVLLLVLHLTAHGLCGNYANVYKKRFLRLLFVSFSILASLSILVVM